MLGTIRQSSGAESRLIRNGIPDHFWLRSGLGGGLRSLSSLVMNNDIIIIVIVDVIVL